MSPLSGDPGVHSLAPLACKLSRRQKQLAFYEVWLPLTRGQMKRKLEIGNGGPAGLSISRLEGYFSAWRYIVGCREQPRRQLPLMNGTPGRVGSGGAHIQPHLEALNIARVA